ncbi:hypothetical protein ES319_A02G144400v1 [Gossypium barbadense]|uniref:Uncharacterized protein n=2 Tax=Gossypium TaxID=3633 RepID=A0A5J5WQX6_GOSBA|nr:hypothetical protein ES319_A02G144400v1 [Gossypium barbadense]TYH28642.1 hypothetical protein ES288_A02G160100v1 [Gossypium darwinii]
MIMMLIKQIQKRENGSGSGGIVVEELVKELKAIKKQNTITHCLLSAMIVVTLFWQVFEASLLLQLKNGFTHPFKSVGSWLVTLLKGPAKSKQHYSYLVDASGSPPSLQVVKITGIADNGGDVRLPREVSVVCVVLTHDLSYTYLARQTHEEVR